MDSINNDLNRLDENDTTNPFYQLLEKQATEFELFGQRLKSEIQNSHREFIKFQQQQLQQQQQQQQQQKSTQGSQNNLPREEFEKTSKDELIDSLKARIEELETDSIIKGQDIEKQNFEIQQLKRELNKNNKNELEKMRRDIEELNEFKANFALMFDSFEQIKLDVRVLKSKLQQKDVENDRLFAEQLQIDENEQIFNQFNSADYIINGVASDNDDNDSDNVNTPLPPFPNVTTSMTTPPQVLPNSGDNSLNDSFNPDNYNPFNESLRRRSRASNISNVDDLSDRRFSIRRSNTYTNSTSSSSNNLARSRPIIPLIPSPIPQRRSPPSIIPPAPPYTPTPPIPPPPPKKPNKRF